MNARSQRFELSLEGRQIEEAVSCVFHTLLLHRSTGKFHYKAEGNYSIGVIGTEDVDCDFIDLTYVRISSSELVAAVQRDVEAFKDALRHGEGARTGEFSLEFYQKRRRQWPLAEDVVPWEVWDLHLDVLNLNNETEHQRLREAVGECLADMVFSICGQVNRPQLYLPKMPVQTDLSLVFNDQISDVQPYLFRSRYEIQGIPSGYSSTGRIRKFSGGGDSNLPGGGFGGLGGATPGQGFSSTMKKLIKDTISM